jgi:hypothetical protein
MAPLFDQHRAELGRPLTIVDLGCGDFQVGHALTTWLPDLIYIGCDIVPELIEHHTHTYASERIRFCQLDIITDALPEGDVILSVKYCSTFRMRRLSASSSASIISISI